MEWSIDNKLKNEKLYLKFIISLHFIDKGALCILSNLIEV